MKPTTLLLAASLVANVALVAVFVTRATDSTASASSANPASSSARSSAKALSTSSTPPSANSSSTSSSSDDARDLALGRAFARFQQKIQAARTASSGDQRWWRNRSSAGRSREEELLARRELSDALIAAFGDDLGIGGSDPTQLAFLSSEKRTALRRITQDYDEMMAKFGTDGVQLASDKEKLKLLRAERDRDIAALLTPAELADYELRASPSAATVRSRYGDGLTSEDDFKKIYALQKAYDDAFTGPLTPETMLARSDAQRKLQDDIRTALGDQSYAALRRATDPELRTLDSLVSRLGLPADTTDRVAASRATYAAESQRINADTTLTPADRRAQLQALGTKAKAELSSTLGAEVADAFSPRANWVNMLQGGVAFSTTPPANALGGVALAGGTQSVYPVMPASAVTRSGGTAPTRQVVNFVASDGGVSSSAPPSGALFGAGSGEPPATRSMQIFSVATTTPSTTSPNPPADTTTTTTVTPAPTPTPAPKQ